MLTKNTIRTVILSFLQNIVSNIVIINDNTSLLYSSVARDSSEIFLICWIAAKETFLVIINVENSCAAEYFCWNCDTF